MRWKTLKSLLTESFIFPVLAKIYSQHGTCYPTHDNAQSETRIGNNDSQPWTEAGTGLCFSRGGKHAGWAHLRSRCADVFPSASQAFRKGQRAPVCHSWRRKDNPQKWRRRPQSRNAKRKLRPSLSEDTVWTTVTPQRSDTGDGNRVTGVRVLL